MENRENFLQFNDVCKNANCICLASNCECEKKLNFAVNNFLIIRVIFLCFLFKKGFFPGTGRANFSLRGLSPRNS